MITEVRPQNFNPKFEVVSCFIEYNGEILMLKRQKFKPQPNTYGVPAGKVEKDENLKQAIIREVQEETGIDLSKKEVEFYKTKYVDYTEYQFVYHCFHCELEEKPKVDLNLNEHQLYIWTRPEDAMRLNLIQDEDSCISDYYNLKMERK